MKNSKRIFLTTVLLSFYSFAAKTVGVWFNVYMASKIGAAGLGLWNLILSVYIMLKTFSGAGMSLLSTRLIIDDPQSRKSNLKKLYLAAFFIGALGMLILMGASGTVSRSFIGDARAKSSLIILSLSLPLSACSCVTNGYSVAKRKMARYALIGFIEQGVRIASSIIILNMTSPGDVQSSLRGVSLGITISEAASFVLGAFTVIKDSSFTDENKKSRGFIKKYSSIALPDALGSVFRSILSAIQNLLIPIGMRRYGAGSDTALSQYAQVHAMALPVVLYPSSIPSVLSSLLIPEIARCKLKEEYKRIRYMIYRVFKPTLIFSLACTAVMLGFSRELSLSVYNSDECARYIALLAPLVPIMYMDMTSDGIMKGLGLQRTVMAINVVDSIISVLMIYFLVPVMGIYGYVLMVYSTETVNFIMSFSALRRHSGIRIRGRSFLLKLCIFSAASVLVTKTLFSLARIPDPTAKCTLMIICFSLIFIALCFASSALTREDIKEVKKLLK